MELAFVSDIVVVAGGMSIDHMGLGICIDVPSVEDGNDLDLKIGIPVDTLGHDIAGWDSISSLLTITMTLTSVIIIPSSTPVRITLTIGISIPIVSVTVIRVISIHCLRRPRYELFCPHPLCNESPVALDRGRLPDPDDHTGYWSCLCFHGHENLYHVHSLCHVVPHYIHYPLYWVFLWLINRGQLMLVTFRLGRLGFCGCIIHCMHKYSSRCHRTVMCWFINRSRLLL